MKDIVVDSCVLSLFGSRAATPYKDFFIWLHKVGVLAVHRGLLTEYAQQKNREIAALIDTLTRSSRLNSIDTKRMSKVRDDRHHKYTCNKQDVDHARCVFLSSRKRLVSRDRKLRSAVITFGKCEGIKPTAVEVPDTGYYT